MAGAVNVRLGATITDFVNAFKGASESVNRFVAQSNSSLANFYTQQDRQQKVFSKGFGRMAADMKSFGSAMTTYVTAPLALAGGAAFKAYGDIDALYKGLKAASGSAEQAGKDFQTFREIAKLPGLGLQEAEQGGVRLEALGYSAETAARYMREFGNAIALGGGGKVEFGNVLTQLTQMSGKSKVLAEDLKPIVNASPVVAKAIQNIFGSVDSETISAKLQAAGKGPKDFIELLVNELAKVERVTGGPKNALENLGDAAKISSFEFMKAADNVFGLTDKINGLGDFVQNAATGFGKMSVPLQGAILGFTALAAAIGPLSFAIGSVINVAPTIIAGFDKLKVAALALTGPVGLITAAVVAFGAGAYSIYQFSQKVDAAAIAEKNFAASVTQANQQASIEIGKVNQLIAVAKNDSNTKQARLNAIKELNAISPKYLGNITLETINTDVASQSVTKYTSLLLLKAKAQLFASKAVEAEAKAFEEGNKQAAEFVTLGDKVGSFLTNGGKYRDIGKGIDAKGQERQKAAIEASKIEAQKYRDELGKINKELADAGEQVATPKQAAGKTIDFKNIENGSKLTKDKTPKLLSITTEAILERAIENLEKVDPDSPAIQNLKDKLEQMKPVEIKFPVRLLPDGSTTETLKPTEFKSTISFNKDAMAKGLDQQIQIMTEQGNKASEKAMKPFKDLNEGIRSILEQSAETALSGMGEVIGGLVTGTVGIEAVPQLLLGTLGDVAMQLGRLAIGIGVGMEAIKKTFESFSGVGAIAAGIGLVALGAAFKAGAAKIGSSMGGGGKPRGYASGGMFSGEQTIRVGEYGSARYNPELVAPLNAVDSKIQASVNNAINGNVRTTAPSGEMSIQVGGRIEMDQGRLVTIIDRAIKARDDKQGKRS